MPDKGCGCINYELFIFEFINGRKPLLEGLRKLGKIVFDIFISYI